MQVISTTQTIATGLPSPTLTNPDMILPWDQPSSTDTSPSTMRMPYQIPSPLNNESRLPRSDRPETSRRQKTAGQSLSPFRNGILTSRPGPGPRRRSNSERGDGRIKYENSRLSYKPSGDVVVSSSPASSRREYNSPKRTIITEDESDEGEDVPDNTYSTPAILEEDEDNPNSHMAMSKRAEEILAIAKKRLTNMEGNLNRARSTLNSRPSSSMSAFNNQGGEGKSLYSLPNDRIDRDGLSPLKHRQGGALDDDAKQGHSRVFSETSVPSSLNTKPTAGNEGLGISHVDITSPIHDTEPSRHWFWNGLNRNTSLANRAITLEPLDEDGPAPHKFEREPVSKSSSGSSLEHARARRREEIDRAASNFNEANPPVNGLTRSRSTAHMRDIRDHVQEIQGKISTLKRRARQDSLYRRSMSNLRTPSPFTAAESNEDWYRRVPLAAERHGNINPKSQDEEGDEEGRGNNGDAVAEIVSNVQVHVNNDSKEVDEGVGALEQDTDTTKSAPAAEEAEATAAIPSENLSQNIELAQPQADSNPAIAHRDSIQAQGPQGAAASNKGAADEEESGNEKSDGLYDSDGFYEGDSNPTGEKHEDRPDAFDYEHFFLYSAFGHYSKKSRNRSSSSSSTGSTSKGDSASSQHSEETTKPANVGEVPGTGNRKSTAGSSNGSHVRKESVESVSSAATFATATESRGADEDAEHEATPRNTVVIPPRSDSLKKKKSSPEQLGSSQKTPSGTSDKRPTPQIGTRAPSNSLSSPEGPPAFNGIASIPAMPPLLTYLASLAPGKDEKQPMPSKPIRIGDRDRELVERLVKSLAQVCIKLESVESHQSKYEARVCRRKLDGARRVLDGEVNGEAF